MAAPQVDPSPFWRRWLVRIRSWWIKWRNGGQTAPEVAVAVLFDEAPLVEPVPLPEPRQYRSLPTTSGKRSSVASDRLVLGPRIGDGGQGNVYRVVGAPDLVYKQYHVPLSGARNSFEKLVQTGQVLNGSQERPEFFWPTRLFGRGDRIEGFTMRSIPPAFTLAFRSPAGERRGLGKLMHALPRTGAFGLAQVLTGQDRAALVALIARGLVTLHSHDVVYRDISLVNIVFSVNPLGVGFMDMDSARVITEAILPAKDGVDADDWRDPMGQWPIGFDMDRYKFALLAYRMLIAHHTYAPLDSAAVDAVTRIDGILPKDVPRVKKLLSRALGPAGTRPPVAEWHAVLAEATR